MEENIYFNLSDNEKKEIRELNESTFNKKTNIR